MTTWSDRTTYQGKRVNQGGKQIMAAANKMVRTGRFGGEKSDITMTQGGYNRGGVSASAGTHDGGGAFDLTAYNWKNRVKVFRLLGVAMFDRPTLRGVWSHHIHGIVCGDGTASAGAKRQVTAYYNGRNGLANNARDKDWRPSKLPILFKLDGNLKDRYCTTACHLYDEPAATTQRQQVAVGDKVGDVVAVVNVKGDYWFITADGKCGFEGNFSTTKPSTTEPEKPVFDTTPLEAEWRVTDTKWGTDGPNGERLYERQAGYHLYTTDKAVVGGITYYVTAYGTWYSADHLVPWTPVTVPDPGEAPTPEPEPQPTEPAEFRVLNINVGADYVSGYGNRLDELEDVRNAARASLVVTCESGNYADGERLNREFGWGGKRGVSFILHGGSVPITTAVHWDPDKYKLLDEGQFVTVPGTTHRWATWVKLKHLGSGQAFICAATHLQYLPKGPNTIRKYDREREAQLGAVLKKVEDLADGLPAIVAGDFNGKRTDAYDGPGKAMTRYGYTDPGTGRALIDRFALKRAKSKQHTVLPTQGGTDHPYAAAIYVALNE